MKLKTEFPGKYERASVQFPGRGSAGGKRFPVNRGLVDIRFDKDRESGYGGSLNTIGRVRSQYGMADDGAEEAMGIGSAGILMTGVRAGVQHGRRKKTDGNDTGKEHKFYNPNSAIFHGSIA